MPRITPVQSDQENQENQTRNRASCSYARCHNSVQGVQFKLSQRTDMMLGNTAPFITLHQSGQWETEQGEMKVLDNCWPNLSN